MPEKTVEVIQEPHGGVCAAFKGMNAVDPPAIIPEDEVQTSTNVDFTIEYGGAAVRRGSEQVVQVSSDTHAGSIVTVAFLGIGQGSPSNTDGIIYANKGATLYRITQGTGTDPDTRPYTSTAIATASGASAGWVGGVYKGSGYFMGGPGSTVLTMVKDDGTHTTDWIKQVPSGTLGITVNTLTALQVVGGTNTFTIEEGSGSAASGTCTITSDPTTFRAEVDVAITYPQGLLLNGTHSLGDNAIDSVDIWFDDPNVISIISRDYGLTPQTVGTVTGTPGFDSYYHTELNMLLFSQAYGDPEVLAESQLNAPPEVYGTITITQNVDLATRQQMIQDMRRNIRSNTTVISQASEVFNSWIVNRVNFQPVIRDPNPGNTWAMVGTARIVVQGTAAFTMKIRNWQVIGANDYSLTDVDLGYSWWETFAAFDPVTGGILGESSPSPSTPRVKISGGNVTIVSTSTATGSHGITHRIYYRQGGYLNDAYAVATNSYAVTTFTDTLSDMSALALNFRMLRSLKSPADFGAVAPRAVSEPWYDRLFLLASNTLSWSMPGRPDAFPQTSDLTFGDGGDIGCGLVLWPPGLVIVNDHSVYEMVGTLFETSQADYVISKSGSKHGSKAPLTTIRTPYGIPLVDYDGLYMYLPGQGIEQPLDWVMAKVGDLWRGQGTTDPAGYKGNRVPAIDMNFLFYSCAAYANNRIYLGLPCETGQARCNVVLVIDFRYKECFIFQYPWTFNSLYWDQYKNQLYALSNVGGNLIQLETGIVDTDDAGGSSNITWSFKTREWSTPADILLENLAIQYRGSIGTLTAIYDQTNTTTIGTLTSSGKVWTQPTLGGSFTSNFAIRASGSQASDNQAVVYNINWDAFIHPKRVSFYRTDYDDNGIEGEKIWDVHYTDMEIIPASGTGTVLGTSFIDGTAVSTFTLTGALPSSKTRYTFAYPPETYGRKEYTIYNAVGTTVFKLWEHNNGGRPEPPRVTSYVTDRLSGKEVWNREWLAELNIGASTNTVTAVVYVDENPIGTYALTSNPTLATNTVFGSPTTGRTVFRTAFPTETYGEVVYVKYTSTEPFKHYRTWYIQEQQPDRLTFWETTYDTSPSIDVLKTWVTEAHPLNGTITGTVFVDGTNVQTATFTGNNRLVFEVGTPNITTGKSIKIQYSSTTVFKLFRAVVEREPKPYLKKTWNVIYKKLGGATQLDLARFYEIDVESPALSTITSTWYADNTAVSTITFSNAAGSHTYHDRISMPPGIRGYVFQQILDSDVPFHLWKSNMDIERVGVKGFSRVTLVGTPQDNLASHQVAEPWAERNG